MATKKSTTKKTEAAPKEKTEEPAQVETLDGPRPWRIETYSDGAKYGYRICDAVGGVIKESPTEYEGPQEAAEAAVKTDLGSTARTPWVRRTRSR